MPLDSDIHNPDGNLHVEFFIWKSDDQWNGKEFIRIRAPGDQTLVVEQPLRDDHKARFPRHWAAYKLRQTGEIPFGTELDTWASERPQDLNDAQIRELRYLGFQNVEQVASASDSQIQKLMGGDALREKGRRYLFGRGSGAASDELEETKRSLALLQEQMATLLAPKADKPPVDEAKKAANAERMAKVRAARGKVKNDGQHASAVGAAGHG